MKKVFKLTDEKKHPDRVLEAVKHEIRKYVKREKKKELPDSNLMYWDFDCKAGESVQNAQTVPFEELIKAIESIKQSGAEEVYVEIIARAEMKPPKAPKDAEASETEAE